MKPLLVSLISLALLTGGAGLTGTVGAQSDSSDTVGFGMDADSIYKQKNAGVKPDYGVMWIGPWTLSSGWGGPSDRLTDMRNEGVTPVIHFYYWGDDISPDCVKNGCWSSLHNTWKSQEGWDKLAKQLKDNLHKYMGGKEVIIIMETEFNKGGMNTYKPFDYQLRDMTNYLKWNYGGAEMVLGLGNWNRGNWGTWTESAKASDYIGVQAMRGSTKDSLSSYNSIYSETLAGAKDAKSLFGKKVFITDIALSSYPEPDYLGHQRDNLKKFFDNIGELKSAGVMAIVYRTWTDQPTKNTANYYGEAERHWGFSYSKSGSWKPAASVWVDGVKAERSGTSSTGSTDSGPEEYRAEFRPAKNVNEWWIDVDVESWPKPAKVDVKVNSGSWTALGKTSWGTWAKSMKTPEGSDVRFRATNSDGDRAYSETYSWLKGTSSPSSAYDADFRVSKNVNEWWVDVFVDAKTDPQRVDVRVDGGSWIQLDSTNWGSWAKSTKVPAGSSVEFRATDPDGERARSDPINWLGKSSTSGGSSTGDSDSGSSAYSAKFEPSSGVNEWWIDVKVGADPNPSSVDVRIDGGSWKQLSKTSWGTWAKSLNAPEGSAVEFRATSPDGERVHSEVFTWLHDSFDASFNVKSQGNNWWVETSIKSSAKVTSVKACVDAEGCKQLSKTDWGSWARSFNVPSGSKVQFVATSDSGAIATSSKFTW